MSRDFNLHSYTRADSGRSYGLAWIHLEPGTDWASAIKVSDRVHDLTVTAMSAPGGHDAVVDINNGASHVEVRLEEAIPQGHFAATIKGGATDVYLKIEKLLTRGRVCDVCLDDWSDQSHEPTRRVELNVIAADGKPVRVIAFKGRPTFTKGSGPYVYAFPWSPLGRFAFLGYVLGPLFAYANPRWLGHPWGFAFDTLRRWGLFRKDGNDS